MTVPQSDKGINVAVPPSNIDILRRGSGVQNCINSKVILGSLVPNISIRPFRHYKFNAKIYIVPVDAIIMKI
jgi:hypothetical protein